MYNFRKEKEKALQGVILQGGVPETIRDALTRFV